MLTYAADVGGRRLSYDFMLTYALQVKLREWRDAVPDGVVYLAPQKKQETTSSAYEAMFRRCRCCVCVCVRACV